MQNSKKRLRILLIGIDGATWKLLKPWINEGYLPTFKKLVTEGSWGVLLSTIPPWTIPAWESIATGKSPDRLRFATFLVKCDGHYRFIPYMFKHRIGYRIWNILNYVGLKTIVMNVPNVYQPERVNGCIVVGWLHLSSKELSYPRRIIQELNRVCQGYIVDVVEADILRGKTKEIKQDYVLRTFEMCLKRIKAFRYVLTHYDWDFAFLVFVATDRLQHKCWNSELLLKLYQLIDKGLNLILASVPEDTTVFVISDHGFGPVNSVFSINVWLAKKGYLKVKILKLLMIDLLRLLRRYTERFSLGFVCKLLDCLLNRVYTSIVDVIDWSKTKAFALSVMGDIYINLKGKFKRGVVSLNEYHELKNKIINELKSEYPQLDIQIIKKEEIYDGATPFDDLPDIIIVPSDKGIHALNTDISLLNILRNRVFEKIAGLGEHRREGIFLAYGPCIRKGSFIEKPAHVHDIAPTILYLLGLPLPKDMNGNPIMDVIEEYCQRPFKRVPLLWFKAKKIHRIIKGNT